jgi:hypothetical protein
MPDNHWRLLRRSQLTPKVLYRACCLDFHLSLEKLMMNVLTPRLLLEWTLKLLTLLDSQTEKTTSH